MITVKQFLDIISKLDRLSYLNGITSEERSAIDTIHSLLAESAVLEEEINPATIKAIFKRAELRINPSTLRELAIYANIIIGDSK